LLRSASQIAFAGFLALIWLVQLGVSQSSGASHSQDDAQLPPALVREVRAIRGKDGTAIEILATRSVTPLITPIENPPRLVIDLPGSLVTSRTHLAFHDEQVRGVRVDQFRKNPPDVRIVVDLVTTVHSNWDSAGNRVTVRLHPPGENQLASSAVPAPQPIAESSSGNGSASGSLLPVGSRIAPGSSLTAGADTAVLHMARGGEVRICPGTTVSVSSSSNGSDLMLGMSTGALEADYQLSASNDSVLTPDFRIVFAGPGEFHYAISADRLGDTCVRALPGNTASAVVSELMGDGVYHVKPTEEVVFRAGHLQAIDSKIPSDCGCRAPAVPVMRAAEAAPAGDLSAQARPAATPAVDAAIPAVGSETASLPAASPKETHIQVDAPFVFRASDAAAPAAPVFEARGLPLTSFRNNDLQVPGLPPAEALPTIAQSSHRGFFGRIRGFFGSIFQ